MAPNQYRLDDRDMAVIESLEPGERYSVRAIEDRFRKETDVRQDKTMRRRVKDLLRQPEFEKLDGPFWRFAGLQG